MLQWCPCPCDVQSWALCVCETGNSVLVVFDLWSVLFRCCRKTSKCMCRQTCTHTKKNRCKALADNRSYKLSVSNQKLYFFCTNSFPVYLCVQRCLSQLLLYYFWNFIFRVASFIVVNSFDFIITISSSSSQSISSNSSRRNNKYETNAKSQNAHWREKEQLNRE